MPNNAIHRTLTRWHSGCLRAPTASSPVPVIADVRQKISSILHRSLNMKTLLSIVTLFLGSLISVTAQTQNDIDDFLALVQKACSNKNIQKIKGLHDFADTPDILVDQAVYQWEQQFSDAERMNGEFAGVEYKALSEYRDNPNVNQIAIDLMVDGSIKNGTLYKPNIPIVGFVSVKFKHDSGSWSSMRPIGMDEAGKLRFAGTMRIKND